MSGSGGSGRAAQRSFALAALVLGAGAVLRPLACQTPTQIVVDIETDDPAICPQVQTTLVFAATKEEGLNVGQQASQRGCKSAPSIGSAVLLPQDDSLEDSEIVVRVVTGLTKLASQCNFGGDEGCIIAKQLVRFVPNQIVSVRIVIGGKCRNVTCGPDSTCNPATGQCAAIPCGSPPCDAPSPDAGADGGSLPPLDGGPPPVAEAGSDTGTVAPCEPATCRQGQCIEGRCVVSCLTANRCTPSTCPANVPCVLTCNGNKACENATCGEASSCEIHCLGDSSCEGKWGCGNTRGACTIACESQSGCAGEIRCSTAATSSCAASCTDTCNERELRCCGTPDAACTAAAPFLKTTDATCE